MKRTANALSVTATIAVIAALMLAWLAGCATAKATFADEPEATGFSYVHDWSEPREPSGMVRIMAEQEARQEQCDAAQAAVEAEANYEPDYADTEAYTGYDELLNNNPAYLNGGVWGNPDGLNSFNGVYDYNGHHETFYASHAIYDGRLWVDDDGFFRDDQGRYVVASSDYEHGTEIEISQGTAVVMDSGPESGTVDVHTTWGS